MKCKFITNGIRINEDGTVIPCCEYNGDPISVFDENFDIARYLASNELTNLRRSLAGHAWPVGCSRCQMNEKNKSVSLRYKGEVEIKEKLFLDVVLGRECNSDCVMCYAGQSSKISSRLKRMPVDFSVPSEDSYWVNDTDKADWFDKVDFWQWLTENIDHFESFKFLGGEPFLHKGLWKWLSSNGVISRKQDCSLYIVTNCSVLHDLGSLEGWNRLIISASIDATKEQYEWIRTGLDWNAAASNLDRLRKVSNCHVSITPTVSIYNIASIAELIEWTEENDLLLNVISLTSPSLLAIDKAPINILQDARDALRGVKSRHIQNQRNVIGLINSIQDAIDNNKSNDEQRKQITEYFNIHRKGIMDWKTLRMTS